MPDEKKHTRTMAPMFPVKTDEKLFSLIIFPPGTFLCAVELPPLDFLCLAKSHGTGESLSGD
jgi:hypothetical protein